MLALSLMLIVSLAAPTNAYDMGKIVLNADGVEISARSGFTDVLSGIWYEEPVAWAIEQGITNGTSATTFSPDVTCSNAQVLTFLWRACGYPDSLTDNPFEDISGGSFYYKAALWSYENNMVEAGEFQPNKPCTRSMAMTYLWKVAGSPDVSTDPKFNDIHIDDDYAKAVAWAVDIGITNGTSTSTFSPDTVCTRAQIMTFLYRNMSLDFNTSPESGLEIVGIVE